MGAGAFTNVQPADRQQLQQTNTGERTREAPVSTTAEQDKLDAGKLAEDHQMKLEEVEFLWKRYKQLEPDEGCLVDKTAFQQNAVYGDFFCKQVWQSIEKVNEQQDMISFDTFLKSVKQFQSTNTDEKLKLLFSWMADDGQLTKNKLGIVMGHALPDEDEELDDKLEIMMEVMDTERNGYITVSQFTSFLHTIPQEQLSKALSFTILDRNGPAT